MIAIDLCGYGDNEQPKMPPLFSLDDEVRLVSDHLDRLVGAGARVHLVGHSYGGLVALQEYLVSCLPSGTPYGFGDRMAPQQRQAAYDGVRVRAIVDTFAEAMAVHVSRFDSVYYDIRL